MAIALANLIKDAKQFLDHNKKYAEDIAAYSERYETSKDSWYGYNHAYLLINKIVKECENTVDLTAYIKDDLRKLLDENFFNDPNCFGDGTRNDCAVDFCIMNWCLGLNPVDEFNKLAKKHQWDDKKVAACREHIDRVVPYLKKWGTKGTMEAMAFAINY